MIAVGETERCSGPCEQTPHVTIDALKVHVLCIIVGQVTSKHVDYIADPANDQPTAAASSVDHDFVMEVEPTEVSSSSSSRGSSSRHPDRWCPSHNQSPGTRTAEPDTHVPAQPTTAQKCKWTPASRRSGTPLEHAHAHKGLQTVAEYETFNELLPKFSSKGNKNPQFVPMAREWNSKHITPESVSYSVQIADSVAGCLVIILFHLAALQSGLQCSVVADLWTCC